MQQYTHTHTHKYAPTHTHVENRETRTEQENRLEKLLRSCRAALDVSRSVKGQVLALCVHCVRTACIPRTQRLGYSPKNTCHLSSSTPKQQSPHENNENAFKGLQGRQTSTCTHLHMHRFINV